MPTFSKLVPILFQSDIVVKQYSVVPRQTAQFPEMLYNLANKKVIVFLDSNGVDRWRLAVAMILLMYKTC